MAKISKSYSHSIRPTRSSSSVINAIKSSVTNHHCVCISKQLIIMCATSNAPSVLWSSKRRHSSINIWSPIQESRNGNVLNAARLLGKSIIWRRISNRIPAKNPSCISVAYATLIFQFANSSRCIQSDSMTPPMEMNQPLKLKLKWILNERNLCKLF